MLANILIVELNISRYYCYPDGTRCSNISFDGEKPIPMSGFTEKIMQIQEIYTKLERTVVIFKSVFSPHLIVILVMKFTALTSLLYFCCMIVIK